jgi:hypothetical protein
VRRRLLVGPALLLAAACGGGDARVPASADDSAARVPVAAPADPLADAMRRVAAADSLRHARPERMRVLAEVGGALVAVTDTLSWPESDVSYNVWTDDAGRPLGHAEVPYSESGDWSAVFVHYFDADGATVALVQHTGWRDAGCRDDMSRTVRAFFAPGLRPLRVDTAWTDGDGRPVDPAAPGCVVRNDLATAPVAGYAALVAEGKAPPP